MKDWSDTTFDDIFVGDTVSYMRPPRSGIPAKSLTGRVASVERGEGGLHIHISGEGVAIAPGGTRIEVYR